jgi:preprotein translocase subunit SecF
MNCNFTKNYKALVFVSILLTLASLSLIIKNKFNLGIDFSGGIFLEVQKSVNEENLQKLISNYHGEVTNSDVSHIIKIKVQNVDHNAIISDLTSKIGDKNIIRTDFIGPKFGSQLVISSIYAIISGVFVIFLYVWLKFSVGFGLIASISLIHDIIIVLAFISLIKFEMNLIIVSAILAIIGYSVNDTIVIFDRIRSLTKKGSKYENVINNAMNMVIKRSIITSFVTMITIFPMCFIEDISIREFTISVLFGIAVGTYSSISFPIIFHKYSLFQYKFKEKIEKKPTDFI